MSDETKLGRNGRLVARFAEMLSTNSFENLGEVVHEDIVQEIPQSGERVRGLDNVRATLARYPGATEAGFLTEPIQIVGEEPRYVMTPTFNLVHIEGTGDTAVAVMRSRYPDGSWWWVIVFLKFRDEKIVKQTTYYAPSFEAPEWRAQWVERMDDRDRHE
jgi:ketosteroid isomerase-like protein